MSIADTIKSLKPGDRVRVTFEDEVTHNHVKSGGAIHLSNMGALYGTDPTITSIEVIKRPLQVGDRVLLANAPEKGPFRVTAIGESVCLIMGPDKCERPEYPHALRRAS
jgi:hypothetical protein